MNEKTKAYKAFRKRYGPLLNSAKREMDTRLQKGLIDAVAGVAFSAGYDTPREDPKPVKLRSWRGRNDKQ
jgi:hypothetical protein